MALGCRLKKSPRQKNFRVLVIILVITSLRCVIAATVKVTTVGNSVGVVLPKEVLEYLRIEKGDTLYISETPGGVQLTPFKPEFAKVVEAGRRVTRKYRNALRKLAE